MTGEDTSANKGTGMMVRWCRCIRRERDEECEDGFPWNAGYEMIEEKPSCWWRPATDVLGQIILDKKLLGKLEKLGLYLA